MLLKSVPGEIIPLSCVCLHVEKVFCYVHLHLYMAPRAMNPLLSAMTLPTLVNWLFFFPMDLSCCVVHPLQISH